MCLWKMRNCSWFALPVATIFMSALSSGSLLARDASIWMTGSGDCLAGAGAAGGGGRARAVAGMIGGG